MDSLSYATRRGQLETYFDSTALAAWTQLTSDAPVSGIRATVRAGRERMRQTLLDWLPFDLRNARVLDAGCGTGALSLAAARRGATVVAIDLAPNLIEIARQRTAQESLSGSIEFRSGDMLSTALGRFDYIIAMDSLIHYHAQDIVAALASFAARARESVLFTFAPRTALLTVMHTVGRAFPRADRAPAIEPVAERYLRTLIDAHREFDEWQVARTSRIDSAFYKSQAMELTHS
jgi:magnesium-protoporphyrin O-methyltransferase